jgi:ZIP family zinc transporter
MLEWLREANPMLQALVGGSLTLALTAIGAAVVVMSGRLPPALLDAMLGFASGVMIAASFWSLLAPAIEMAEGQGTPAWIPAAVGFVAGAVFLRLADRYLPHLHPGLPMEEAEGIKTPWQRTTLLVLAITLHNIPEGLAVGVAFGAAATGMGQASGATFASALALTIGIGLQNAPEGIAVAMPLRAAGVSRWKSFLAGTASAAVEPIAAVIGAAAVVLISALLPYALSFAAGAMIYVVVEELIPAAQRAGRADLATTATIGGFTVMMILDVALG